MACAQPSQAALTPHSWTEKADVTWEEIFGIAYKNLIPLLKELGEQLGREKFVEMLRGASNEAVRKRNAGRPPLVRDLVTLEAAYRTSSMPPIIQHAMEVETLEQSPEAFEQRVSKCLWAKMFRGQDAADIGYAMVCYADYAVAKGLNPKLQLIRTKTLMQGADSCRLRYVMEA